MFTKLKSKKGTLNPTIIPSVLFIFFILLGLLFPGIINKELPTPEISAGVRGDLGIDKNINESTIDNYLEREDSVYFDMRMINDPADYSAISGDSYLSGYIKGFEILPYPYLCNPTNLPTEVGNGYSGPALFSLKDDNYIANYKESLDILNSIFPKDKNIFLMCGGGGYAGMTKNLLVNLGWNENKIYNVGGYWYYNGKNKVEVSPSTTIPYHDINFDNLLSLNSNTSDLTSEQPVLDENFENLLSLADLNTNLFNKKTYIALYFTPGCSSCANFNSIVKEMSKNKNIKVYSFSSKSLENASFTNSLSKLLDIKYAPSFLIFKDGDLVSYLRADSDFDEKYYKDSEKLYEFISGYINVSLLESNDNCSSQEITEPCKIG